MKKYPDLKEKSEVFSNSKEKNLEALQTSTEIINDEISLDDDIDKKSRQFSSNSTQPHPKDSMFNKLQVAKDPFMDKRDVVISEVKTTTEWSF